MGELERRAAGFDPSAAIDGEIGSSVPADPNTPVTPYQILPPRGPALCDNCPIRGDAVGEVEVKATSIGMDTLSGFVILCAEDGSGGRSKSVRVNHDANNGIGSDEAMDDEYDLTRRILLCEKPSGRIPGFRKCGALARYMQT